MLLKKLFFLMIPLVVVYWRSRTAQNAARWVFRGVIPEDGPLGKVVAELREPPSRPPGSASADMSARRPVVKRSAAAQAAAHWPVVLAFVAGIALAAILFSRWSYVD
jgi:hypothetical protein